MSVITNQPLVRHPFNIHNGSMVTSASLPQYHTEGYAEGVGFNYGFIQNPDTDTATNKYWHPLKGNIIEYWHVPSEGNNPESLIFLCRTECYRQLKRY